MIEKRMCQYCRFLKQIGRQQAQRNVIGRKKYYCVHPLMNGLKDKYGMPQHNFVGFGDMTNGSPLTLKTHPRWCQMESKGG